MTTTSSAFSALAAQAATGVSSPLAGAGVAFATAGGGVTDGTAAFPLSGSPADPLAGLARWQRAPQTQVAALPVAAGLVAGVSVADIVAVGVVAYSGAVLLNDRRGAQAAVARMTRDIADRLQWPGAQLATAQAELFKALNNLSASVRSGTSLPHMKEHIVGAITSLHWRLTDASPAVPAAVAARSVTAAAPRFAASRQATTEQPPNRPTFSPATIQALQRMLPTQSVATALRAAGHPVDGAPQGLTSLPVMAAQYAKLKSLQRSPQWPLLARHLGPEVSAIQASLGQANGAMKQDASKAMSLMNAAEPLLHGGKSLSGNQSETLRATAVQLRRLQSTIEQPYAALRTAGFYEAERHPVARQIATWLASFPSRLDTVTRPAAAGSLSVPAKVVAATAATAPGLRVDRPTAAVDAAVQAIGRWGELAQQWVKLPTNASPERRVALEGLVMRAGRDLQRALSDGALKQVMQAGASAGSGRAVPALGTASASPPPEGKGPDFKELGQRLIAALLNGVGSVVADGLQSQFGQSVSADGMQKGMLLAMSLGLMLPPGTQGVIKGSVINGFAGAAETGSRQISGIDAWDPAAVVASLAFGALGNATVHHLAAHSRVPGLRSPDLGRVLSPELPARVPQREARFGRTAQSITIDSTDNGKIPAIRNRLRPDDPQASKRPNLYISPDSEDGIFQYLSNFDPSKILLRGKGVNAGGQVPVTPEDWPRIAVFNWHGGPNKFDRLSTEDAARHMAREVELHNRIVGSSGEGIQYVLLESCHQGTRGGLLPLWGTTNAQRFARMLNAELERLGAPAVDVLAARDAGPIAFSIGESRLVGSHVAPDFSADPVVFVTPDQQRGRLDYYTGKLAAHRVGAASVAATVLAPSAKFVYQIVNPHPEEE